MSDIYKQLAHKGEEVDAAIEGISSHKTDTTLHITAAERTAWNKNTTDISAEVSARETADAALQTAVGSLESLNRAVTLESGDDLNDLYVKQSPSNVDDVVRKWVIPSAAVGATLLNLPPTYKTVYPNCEIEWHTVKSNGVGYQVLTGGTNSSFQRFMRFRTANGWSSWYVLFDTDNATAAGTTATSQEVQGM